MKRDKLRKAYVPMTETAFYMLLSLLEPRHGYGIMKHVEELTKGRIQLGSGTVYGTLTKMQRDGLIHVYSTKERKKMYQITVDGQHILKIEMHRLSELHSNAMKYGGDLL
ncbi:PadR family transcriptional regulator [Virgibacillus sp. Bac330]|uniref:PadR family transcriptional regulator n=1 Tax=Virgibacillus sp. Bac330 TaxID=2419841 RepID=UPI001F09D34B|nr:PadR family transcriptional regulator [Virgibacillus sp. Bac330]